MLRVLGANAVIATQIEIMNTPASRSRGLLKFESAPRNYAAIFELPFGGFFPAIHTFGMKFEIDILFCDAHRKICARYSQVAPGRWILPISYFLGGIRYIIEVPEPQDSLKVGDRLDWSLP